MKENENLTVEEFIKLVNADMKIAALTDSQYMHKLTDKVNWYSIEYQKTLMIDAAYKAFINHGDKMSPEDIVKDVLEMNKHIFQKIVAGRVH